MKLGFIGFGNMAQAMAQGAIRHGGVDPARILVSARDKDRLARRAEGLGVTVAQDNRQVARDSDILFLAVKPYLLAGVIAEIRDDRRRDALIVSVAAGVSLQQLEDWFGEPTAIVRTLPNTPVAVGQGMTLYCSNSRITPEAEARLVEFLASFGLAERVTEDQFAGPGSMTGCSPAFLYMLMEAMADAAVLKGMPREAAYRMAAQTVKGSAQMVLETGLHPGALKDMVTSPGGTTIEGVRTLERLGFRSAIMEAIIAAAEKTGK